MTRDQQKSITEFVVRTAHCCESELDVEADAIIRALFVRNPDAAYRMTMLAMAQEQELSARRELDTVPDAQQSKVEKPASVGRWLNGMLNRDARPRGRITTTKARS
jgi:hypothetical protein